MGMHVTYSCREMHQCRFVGLLGVHFGSALLLTRIMHAKNRKHVFLNADSCSHHIRCLHRLLAWLFVSFTPNSARAPGGWGFATVSGSSPVETVDAGHLDQHEGVGNN